MINERNDQISDLDVKRAIDLIEKTLGGSMLVVAWRRENFDRNALLIGETKRVFDAIDLKWLRIRNCEPVECVLVPIIIAEELQRLFKR